MATSGLLQGGNVVFYHPLDTVFVEDTQGQAWTGPGGNVAGKIGTADSAISANSLAFGTAAEVDDSAGFIGFNDIVKMSSTTFVTVWRDATDGRGKAAVCTVSGSSITVGPQIEFFASAPQNLAAAALDSTKFVVFYNSNNGRSKVGTINGTDINFGSEATLPEGGSITIRELGSFGHGGNSIAKLDSTHVIAAYRLSATLEGNASVGTVSGTDIVWGTATAYSAGNHAVPSVITALSVTKVVVCWRDLDDSDIGKVRVGTVSGTSVTFGSTVQFAPAAFSISVISTTASQVVVFYKSSDSGPRLAHAKIGTVTGTDITFGAAVEVTTNIFGNPTHVTLAKLDSTTIAASHTGSNLAQTRVGVIAGLTISWGASNLDAGIRPGLLGMTSTSVILQTQVGNGPLNVKVGELNFLSSLTAPSPDAYPDAIGATRIATAFWTNNPTKGDATLTVERGYSIALTATSISLGGTTAVWDNADITTLMDESIGLNDGSSHLLVMDFVNTGGTNWNLQTSVDGAAFTDQGVQDSGTQSVTTVTTDPNVSLSDPLGDSGQWVDELVMWVDNDLFSTTELDNLFELANTFGEPMNQFQSQFGAPVCWQATAKVSGNNWSDSGAGSCPAVIRVPRGATDVVVTDNGAKVFPRILEG